MCRGNCILSQWRRQEFVTGGSEVWVYRGSRVRSPPVLVVLSVYQRGSSLDGLAMYLSCDTKKFHDNESTHILSLHNFWTSTHRGEASPFPPSGGATVMSYGRRRAPRLEESNPSCRGCRSQKASNAPLRNCCLVEMANEQEKLAVMLNSLRGTKWELSPFPRMA